METYGEDAKRIIDELHTERLDYTSEYLPLVNCAMRCIEYEGTGLTPEEVESLVSVREISPEAEYAIDQHADGIIKRLDALLQKDDCWVSAKESLPPNRTDVLVVALFDEGWQTRMGSYIEGQWVVQTMAGCIYGRPVSYWMPLPEPPEVR